MITPSSSSRRHTATSERRSLALSRVKTKPQATTSGSATPSNRRSPKVLRGSAIRRARAPRRRDKGVHSDPDRTPVIPAFGSSSAAGLRAAHTAASRLEVPSRLTPEPVAQVARVSAHELEHGSPASGARAHQQRAQCALAFLSFLVFQNVLRPGASMRYVLRMRSTWSRPRKVPSPLQFLPPCWQRGERAER